MNEFLTLKILDSFKKIFERFGINYKLLRNILKTKLTLDMRRAPAINTNNKNKQDEESTSIIKGYLLHLIFGVFLAFFIYFIKDEMIRMMYFSGAFFFMTTMYLISDFSFVLLDTKDKNILMTKPLDSKTVSLSKVLHILIYMFRLNAFIAGPSMIVMVISNGYMVIPIFLLEILLMDLLIFLVTAFIYLLVLRFFDGELLRNIINVIQILLTILVTVGYQIAVRMIDFTSLQDTYVFSTIHYINPIMWFGAPFEIVYHGGESYLYVFTALIIAVPVVSFVFYLSLSKKMESLLLKLEGEGSERHSKHRIEKLVGMIISRNKVSKQSFHFSNAMFRSDRSLKLKIYPALSSGILLPVLMILNTRFGGRQLEVSGNEYLYLYFNLIMFPTIYYLVNYSSAWKGSYIFVSSGFTDMINVYEGLMQSMAYRFFIPLIILNGVIYTIIFKFRFTADILILLLASIAIMPFIGKLYLELPFSKPIDESNQKDTLGKFLLSLGIVAVFAILHFLSHTVKMGGWIYLAILLAAVPITWKFVPRKI